MKDTYFKYYSGALPAEEYAALLAAREGENGGMQTAESEGCGCESGGASRCQHCIYCCKPISCHTPVEPVEEGCCCRQSFRTALRLLCGEELAELLDFELSAFVTDDYVAGAAVTETVDVETPADNLVAPLAGIFRRLTACTCDLLDITAPLFAVPATPTGLTVTQVNLCELVAVVIQLAETEAEGDLTAEEVAARNFRRVRRILAQRLDRCGMDDGDCCACACTCGDECCCAAGIKAALAGSNLSRRVTLAAGPLLLNGVTLLGTVGNVLVLANDEDLRIYFVCVSKVEFLA